jgi:hypothetical protein
VIAWALVYPLNPGAHFLYDDNGDLGVDVLGAHSRLQADFIRIFSRFAYTEDELVLPNVNVSRNESQRIDRDWLDRVVQARTRRDREVNEQAEGKESLL